LGHADCYPASYVHAYLYARDVADSYHHAHAYAHANADVHVDAAAHPHTLVD
jgi:hypothetical protein